MCWTFLLDLLQHMGFGLRWRNWISAILATTSTKILLNGNPGRQICHARGLRQGAPISDAICVGHGGPEPPSSWLESRDLLTPMTGLSSPRASLYANDLVMFVRLVDGDLRAVRAALQIFGQASGLIANLDKSVATPLHCSSEEITRVQQLLSYRIEEFPTRYLGIPLSVYKLRRSEEQPLIDKVAARIPEWKGNLLNEADRTALVKATLSHPSAHVDCDVSLPLGLKHD